jgi:hypothetical protein
VKSIKEQCEASETEISVRIYQISDRVYY